MSRLNNGAPTNRFEVYANRGAEIWFEAKRLIEEKKMILPEVPVFIQQATNRRVEYTATQKLRVESKEAMRNRGVSSPDRTDAVSLGFRKRRPKAPARKHIPLALKDPNVKKKKATGAY